MKWQRVYCVLVWVCVWMCVCVWWSSVGANIIIRMKTRWKWIENWGNVIFHLITDWFIFTIHSQYVHIIGMNRIKFGGAPRHRCFCYGRRCCRRRLRYRNCWLHAIFIFYSLIWWWRRWRWWWIDNWFGKIFTSIWIFDPVSMQPSLFQMTKTLNSNQMRASVSVCVRESERWMRLVGVERLRIIVNKLSIVSSYFVTLTGRCIWWIGLEFAWCSWSTLYWWIRTWHWTWIFTANTIESICRIGPQLIDWLLCRQW